MLYKFTDSFILDDGDYFDLCMVIFVTGIILSTIGTLLLGSIINNKEISLIIGLIPIIAMLSLWIGNIGAMALVHLITEGEKELEWGYFSKYLLSPEAREKYMDGEGGYHPITAIYLLLSILVLAIGIFAKFTVAVLTILIIWGILYVLVLIARKAYKLSKIFNEHEENPNAHKGENNG